MISAIDHFPGAGARCSAAAGRPASSSPIRAGVDASTSSGSDPAASASSRAVYCAKVSVMSLPVLEQAEIARPRTDMASEGADQNTRQLRHVRHVVRRPCGEQLFERHRAELRMLASEAEMRRRQAESIEALEIGAPQLPELPDQRVRRPALVARESAFAIVRREAAAAVEN